jgi:hypothetical protein
VKQGERWRIGRNKDIKDVLQETDIVKFIKSLGLEWYGRAEIIRNQRMPKQIAAAAMEQG